MKTYPCPYCHGKGGWVEVVDPELGGPPMECTNCNATGKITVGSTTHIENICSTWFHDIALKFGFLDHLSGNTEEEAKRYFDRYNERVEKIIAIVTEEFAEGVNRADSN